MRALSGILFVAIRLVVGAESILFYWMVNIPIISVIIWHIIIFPLLLLISGLKKKPSARSFQDIVYGNVPLEGKVEHSIYW